MKSKSSYFRAQELVLRVLIAVLILTVSLLTTLTQSNVATATESLVVVSGSIKWADLTAADGIYIEFNGGQTTFYQQTANGGTFSGSVAPGSYVLKVSKSSDSQPVGRPRMFYFETTVTLSADRTFDLVLPAWTESTIHVEDNLAAPVVGASVYSVYDGFDVTGPAVELASGLSFTSKYIPGGYETNSAGDAVVYSIGRGYRLGVQFFVGSTVFRQHDFTVSTANVTRVFDTTTVQVTVNLKWADLSAATGIYIEFIGGVTSYGNTSSGGVFTGTVTPGSYVLKVSKSSDSQPVGRPRMFYFETTVTLSADRTFDLVLPAWTESTIHVEDNLAAPVVGASVYSVYDGFDVTGPAVELASGLSFTSKYIPGGYETNSAGDAVVYSIGRGYRLGVQFFVGSTVFRQHDFTVSTANVNRAFALRAPLKPSTPNVTAEPINDEIGINIQWIPRNADSFDVDQYNVRLLVESENNWQVVETFAVVRPSLNASSAVVTGVQSGQNYKVQIAAANVFGMSEWSDASSVIHIEAPASTTVPDVSTTVPDVSTTVPDVSTTVPDVSTTVPDVSTTVPDVSTTGPALSGESPEIPVLPTEARILELPNSAQGLIPNSDPARGDDIRVRLGGFVPGEEVILLVASTPRLLAKGIADSAGFIDLTGTIPMDLESGDHSLVIFAPASGRGFRQSLSILVPALPATGQSSSLKIRVAFLTLLLGLLSLSATRRRFRNI